MDVDSIPDETTILNFRHLLERHKLGEAILEEVNTLLEEQGLLLREGSVVDATIIHASTSTKNSSGSRDPEMRSTKKGNQWYFGMKAHIGVDAKNDPRVFSKSLQSKIDKAKRICSEVP